MEDQNVNGNIWNKQATELLTRLGWKRVGDHDIDLKGSDKDKYGVDTLMTFETPLKSMPQSVILEAKRYLTTSFQAGHLQTWVKRLDEKLVALRESGDLFEMFPELEECTAFNVGLLVIWFSDIDEYKQFRPKFLQALEKVNVSWRERKAGKSAIFVIDNMRITRLCALEKAVKELGDSFEFTYPPAYNDRSLEQTSKTLTVEYMFSDVVIGSFMNTQEESVVFYFGENNTKSFTMLKNALTRTSVWKKGKPLHLYLYNSDIDLRKIKPSIENLFAGIGSINIKFMESNNDIPSYLKDIITDE